MSDKEKTVKDILLDVFCNGLKAQNSADDKEPDKEEKPAENKKACNEDVDKRKLIDEVGGILKGKVDDEIIRTIIGKLEKVAYDKSEAGTADNCKAKNEDDDDKEKKEFEKAQNSLDDVKKLFYQGKYTNPQPYMTQKQGIELGKKLY